MLNQKREIEFQFEGSTTTKKLNQKLSKESILIIQNELLMAMLDSEMRAEYKQGLSFALAELSTLKFQEA